MSAVAGGVAIDFVLASVVFAAVLAAIERFDPRSAELMWATLLGFLALKLADSALFLLSFYGVGVAWSGGRRAALLCAVWIAAMLLWRFRPRAFQNTIKVARVSLLGMGCCIFWMLPGLLLTAARTNRPTANAFSRAVRAPSRLQCRVIWILLDELSYDQVYEHRQADVELPHFDDLKSNSVVFSDVQPAGFFTERIVPSLLLGRRIDSVRSSVSRDLEVHFTDTMRWEPFDQQASIFGEAKRLGWTTGVAGWYNPYCDILRDVLDSCYWEDLPAGEQKLSATRSAFANAVDFPSALIRSHLETSTSRAALMVEPHAEEYKELLPAAEALIQNQSIDFVFLHLPVPHPPGIYNRKTNTLGVTGSYLDNLVLADKTVGNLLGAIDRTAAADRTVVIVSSDHSWRVNLWRNDPSWTAESERVSGGRFDPRPFLLMHFPEEKAGELRTEPFPELATNGILSAILTGKIRSQGQLNEWLDEREAAGRWNSTQSGY